MIATAPRLGQDETRHLFVTELELLSADDFDAACDLSRRMRIPLPNALAERGRVPLKFILEQLAQSWGVRFTDLKITSVRPAALKLVREDYARSKTLMPFQVADGRLHVAMADPRDQPTLRELTRLARMPVVAYLAQEAAIQRAHLLYRGDLRALLGAISQQASQAEGDATATDTLRRVLEFAAVTGASDIHIEPYPHELLVRCRVDGVLQDVLSLPASASTSMSARIKVLAGMRVDDKRSAQDGRFCGDASGVRLDLRVSSLPTQFGEKIVMRVIPTDAGHRDLESLGLTQADLQIMQRGLCRPHGMVLITGPTGSGKSTTLYAMLAQINTDRRSLVNISTIEDPVEHSIPRVAQVSVNAAAGIDFASGLRALLRQDPDVIMVGEIRDRETAEIAVRTALVGRLLISSLHTNDTVSAVPRLIDMGIEPFLLSSTLNMVIAQRLVRQICTGCRESTPVDDTLAAAITRRPDMAEAVNALRGQGLISGTDLEGLRLFRGRGCPQCSGSGFRGRMGIFEVLELDDEMRRLILTRPDAGSMRELSIRKGARTMLEDGLAKVVMGETTLDELIRVAA